jgi:cellobiose-specific phosphotransferase system component IIC
LVAAFFSTAFLATGCFLVTAFVLEAFLLVTVDLVLTFLTPIFVLAAFFVTGLTAVSPVSAELCLVILAMVYLPAHGYENEQLAQRLQISNQFG